MKAFFSRTPVVLIGLFATVLGLGACTTKTDLETLRMDVDRRNEARLQQTQSPIQTQQADLWAELETIKSRLNDIQGQLEGMAQAQNAQKGPSTQDLARQVEAIRTAVQQLGGDVPPPASALPMAPMSSLDLSQARAALAADPAKGQAAVVIPMPGQALVPAVSATPVKDSGDVAQNLYERAMGAFRDKKYDDAQRMFEEFTTTFKKHALVPDALAWRGDSLFQMNKYAEAVLVYDEVRSKFPKSNRVQPAMLKEGICLYKLGKKEAGKHLLLDLIKRFPSTPQAKAASNYINTNG